MSLHLDAAELAWILISLAGVILALSAHADVRDDLAAVEAAGGDELECALVENDVADARWIVVIEAGLLLVGVLAAFTPAPPGGRSPLGWVIVAVLMTSAAGLPGRLYDRRRRRRRLLRLADRRAR